MSENEPRSTNEKVGDIEMSEQYMPKEESDERFYLSGRVGLTDDEITWVIEHKARITSFEGEDKTPIENSVVSKLLATIAYLEKE